MGTPVGRRSVLALGVGVASLPLLSAAPAVASPGKAGPSGAPFGKDRVTSPRSAPRPAPPASASQIAIDASDTPDTIVRKASQVVPRPSQVAWQQREVTAFTHFGMNTFTNREWGSGAEDEATFDPSGMDADQWMRAYKAAGARQVMFTAKHHDGFVLFPTRYSNHSVIASPWWIRTDGCSDAERTATAKARAQAEAHRSDDPAAYWRARNAGCRNPQGDVLGTYLKAARRAGLKVGVYLSPPTAPSSRTPGTPSTSRRSARNRRRGSRSASRSRPRSTTATAPPAARAATAAEVRSYGARSRPWFPTTTGPTRSPRAGSRPSPCRPTTTTRTT